MNDATTLRIFTKTCQQINNIKDTNYKLIIANQRDISKKEKLIHITKYDTKTNLEHSLAHILYDSKVPNIEVLKQISHTGSIQGCMILKDIIHTLEAERVEYNWGLVYYGSKQQFEKQRNGRITDAELDPISAIQFVRNGEIDQVKGTKYEKAIDIVNGVHGCDHRMSIKLAIEWYNEFIKDFINDNIQNKLDQDDKTFQDVEIKGNSYYRHQRDKQEFEHDKTISNYNFQLKFMNHKRGKQNEFEHFSRNGTVKQLEKIQNMDIEKLKKSGEKKIQKINQQLLKVEKPPNTLRNQGKFKMFKSERREGEYTIDKITARRLEKIFNRIRARRVKRYDEYGEIIDIDEYIQNNINNENKFWDMEKKEIGLTIVIGIDLSGSMANKSVDECRDMCGTILSATRRLSNVRVVFVPWSTSNYHHDLTAEELTTFNDIKRITKNEHNQNANDLAHQYLDDIAQRFKGKKVIIMMTDGEPFCYGIEYKDLLKNTKNAIKHSKKNGHTVYGVYFGYKDETLQLMKDMYQDDFINCVTIQDTSKAIIELVKKSVLQVL